MAMIDYGPLQGLIGCWEGASGMDVAPEDDGAEHNPYYETLTFEPCGDVSNADSQTLVVLRYHQVVKRQSNHEVFHDQVGYWTWDSERGEITQSLSIPRAVCVLAGGAHSGRAEANGDWVFELRAKNGDPDWSVIESPFMRDQASTREYRIKLTLSADRLRYQQTTLVDIFGRCFEHTDENRLTRCSASA